MGSIVKHMMLAAAGVALVLAPLILPDVARSESLSGPVPARVVRVIDGDTVEVRARVWLGQDVTTNVRLAGVDAPELGGRAKCRAERELAEEARAFLEALTLTERIGLSAIENDKYGGRVVARITLPGGGDLGERLVAEGLAMPYGAQATWCNARASEPAPAQRAAKQALGNLRKTISTAPAAYALAQ